MDFKTSIQKHSSKNIPYVRTQEGPNSGAKPIHGPNFIFQYRTSFIAMLFSTLLVGCFIMIVIYFNMQTDRYSESLQVEKEFPHSSQVSLNIDPEMRRAVIAMSSDNDILIPMPFLQDEVNAITREKRQIKNPTDCKSTKQECSSILKAVREVTETMNSHLEVLKNRLIQLKVLSAHDPQEVNYQKIMDCLQCANAIDHKQEDPIVDLALPHGDYQSNAHISEVLPYFDNQHSSEDDEQKKTDKEEEEEEEEEEDKVDERVGRGLTKQVMESVTNSSKVTGGAKITEILHNTTIVENDQGGAANNNRGQVFHHRPVNQNMGIRGGESHVTRNMGAVTPMVMPTAETTMIYQQGPFARPGGEKQYTGGMNNGNANLPSGLHPFILPTAETTKYSQQIQITPQQQQPPQQQPNAPLVPLCFYIPPSGTPQQPPFFAPQGMNPGLPPNQPTKFFPSNGQSTMPFTFQSSMPAQFFQSSSAQVRPPFPMMNQPSQQNAPYYCTYVPVPNAPTQQAYPQMPMMNSFPGPYVGGANQQQKSMPKEKVIDLEKQPMSKNFPGPYVVGTNQQQSMPKETVIDIEKQLTSAPKSTYDSEDDQYWVNYCDGFTCPPPYKKCIAHHQRCDGRVDCIGAEDEIDCPLIQDNYYSRFLVENQAQQPQQVNPAVVEDITKTISTYMATTMYPITDTTDSNDVETTPFTFVVPEMPKMFKCKRIVQTVMLDKRCNGVFDCEDASDEEGCTCKDYLQHTRPYAVCDGHVDCADGSDEQGCNFCRNDEYHCHRSGGCISRNKVCNQANDCKLNEDELDCFVLTDGQRVNLDVDKRPHLNLAGVLTRYERGAWRPSCFKSEYRGEAKRTNAGQKICEYLGFRNVDTVNEVIVPKSRLEERSATSDVPISYEYPPHFTPMLRQGRQVGGNDTCYGLYIRCKPILDKKMNVHLQINPETKERNYIWPWEGSVFVDGNYHCPAVLLEKNVLLASSKCSEGIDLRRNYTSAVFGVSSPDVPYNGPYQQASQVVDIRPIKNSDASLFRLKDGVNMTRYVQPIYLEKRIFPAAKSDNCVALGVNGMGERKMKFLQPVVDNCPKCHRCYVDKNESMCSRFNETTDWHGNIVCLSTNGGWYPTAVFQDKDENCGFNNKQTLNSIDYIHAHLSEAIDEQTPDQIESTCDGVRCAFGECVPWNRVCNGVRDCRDGADENVATCTEYDKRCQENISECRCSPRELRCKNGKCVPKEKFCDGKLDCEDGSDEPASCTCAEYLKLTKPKLVCDNRRHCLDKSDEDYRHCHCKDSSFKCHKSNINGTVPCISPDVVCDGHPDCPGEEDESDAACLTVKQGRYDAAGRGELQKRTYGVWQTMCMSEPIQSLSTVQAACMKMGYRTGLLLDSTKTAEAIYVPRNDFYMFQPNNHTWVTLRDDESFGVWIRPTIPCYRLHVHCF